MTIPFLNVRPRAIKLKVLPRFPARLVGRTGIDVVKVNGEYFVDLDYAKFGSNPTAPAGTYALVFNPSLDAYVLVPASAFGGISEAPNDGQQYARQSLNWSVVAGGGGGIPEAPNDGALYGREGAAWQKGVKLAGDTMTGLLALSGLPTLAAHAASKQYVDNAYRERLTAARTYFVRTDGNDANTGLANSAGGAFLTIQKAIDALSALDMSTFQVTIQVANGTYAGLVTLKRYVGALRPIIQGDTTTPANVLLNSTGHNFFNDGGPPWQVQGFKCTNTGGSALYAINGGVIYFQNIDFGATVSIHIWGVGGIVAALGNYTVSAVPTGGNSFHAAATAGGYVSLSSVVITLPNALNFASASFVLCSRAGVLESFGNTFAGAGVAGTTGPRYNVSLNGVIYVGGGGANYFPGSSAGVVATGGQYA